MNEPPGLDLQKLKDLNSGYIFVRVLLSYSLNIAILFGKMGIIIQAYILLLSELQDVMTNQGHADEMPHTLKHIT